MEDQNIYASFFLMFPIKDIFKPFFLLSPSCAIRKLTNCPLRSLESSWSKITINIQRKQDEYWAELLEATTSELKLSFDYTNTAEETRSTDGHRETVTCPLCYRVWRIQWAQEEKCPQEQRPKGLLKKNSKHILPIAAFFLLNYWPLWFDLF